MSSIFTLAQTPLTDAEMGGTCSSNIHNSSSLPSFIQSAHNQGRHLVSTEFFSRSDEMRSIFFRKLMLQYFLGSD